VLRLCERVASSLPPGRPTPLTVLAFKGVGSEPDTSGLINLLHSHGYVVALPRVKGDHLVAVPHFPGDTLRAGAYNIPEPLGAELDPETIDVVVVPGLAFTTDGRRLGQGGGYYDRFLPLLRPECKTCGVGFSEQMVDDLPHESHDRVLSSVITDASIVGDLAE